MAAAQHHLLPAEHTQSTDMPVHSVVAVINNASIMHPVMIDLLIFTSGHFRFTDSICSMSTSHSRLSFSRYARSLSFILETTNGTVRSGYIPFSSLLIPNSRSFLSRNE